ncbi:MAG TPA: hypothetical protein VIY72_16655 [Acidimicrobiales bacterium]
MNEATPPVVGHREPRKGHLALLIVPIAVMVAMGYLADALWPTLVEEHPLWLLGLSARNRYAVLVVNRVDLWAYYLVGTVRLLLPDPFFFALGWLYGPAALRWMEQRTPTVGSQMRRIEGWFGRWGYPLVMVLPNNYVCLIAGAARMSIPVFAALNVVGTVGRLLFLQVLGDVFSGPIDSLLGWIADYRIPLLVVSIVIVAIMAGGELRRGRKEIEGLQELEQSGEVDPESGSPPRAGDGTDEGDQAES